MEKNNISYLIQDSVAKLFGTMPDGTEVNSYTIANDNGLEATFINYGATITSLRFMGTDVVLGFDTLQDYIDCHKLPSVPYIGAVIGRYAGRIKKGKFKLGDAKFKLNTNLGDNTLHGGNEGLDQKVWQLKKIEDGASSCITFSYISRDGEENFPGELAIEVTYTLTENNELEIEYNAVTTKDTVINLTQHSYFNLDGHEESVSGQDLWVNSVKTLETKPDNIPTGLILNVSHCPYDFTEAKKCPEKIDNSFVIEDNNQPAASLYSSRRGLKMTVYTNQPSVHIYVGGNCFGEIKGKDGADYHPLSGICFEAQNYPDAPNHPNFPNSVLKPGDTYYHKTAYKFEQLKNQKS